MRTSRAIAAAAIALTAVTGLAAEADTLRRCQSVSLPTQIVESEEPISKRQNQREKSPGGREPSAWSFVPGEQCKQRGRGSRVEEGRLSPVPRIGGTGLP